MTTAPQSASVDVDHPEPPPSRAKRIGLVAGPVAAATVHLLLAVGQPGLSADGRLVASVAALMAVWWMTEALPFAATALLPLLLFPLLGVTEFDTAATPYANDTIFLFMGGFMLAAGMQRWNLHTRIALAIVAVMGTSTTRIIAGFMIATTFITMWVSNSASTMMMVPIGLSLVHLSARGGEPDRNFATCVVLGIAYAATIGGMASTIGAAPNAMLAAYLGEAHGIEVTFLDWFLTMLPVVLVFLVVAWFLLTRVIFRIRTPELPGGAELIAEQRATLGRMSRGEARLLAVFAAGALSWVVFPLLARTPLVEVVPWLSRMSDATVAIAVIVALFLVPSGQRPGQRLMTWSDTREVPWGVLLLFGGGLSLSAQFSATDLGDWVAEFFGSLSALPLVAVVAAMAVVVVLVGELMSNTAATALFLPIAGGVAIALGADPVVLPVAITMAASVGFVLPVATPPNAIAFASGHVTTGQMARAGGALDLVGLLLVVAAAHTVVPLML
ncbi:DASS family sodium-coupled anion symporter [Saccharopolyspora cebuensis]|uniref:Sodium-dependent dicarboxylate transporter SdcS n=1 Tax=Saccharopolyspora cebuensis TaxID=418759 RepID=A0ABV4CNR1_9PSEU